MDFVKKNEEILPVEANITWLPDDNLFRIMVRDITLQKKLDESRRLYSERLEKEVEERTLALRDSEEEARAQQKTAEGIIYGSPIPMFVLNKDHRIIYWNKACENLTGFRSEEMIGTDRHWEPFFPHKRPIMADLILDGDLDTLRELYKDMHLRESSVVEGAFEAEHYFSGLGPEGTHLYFNAAPIKDDLGNIQGAIVTYQDFSERVQMTQEMKRRESFVQNLIQNSIDGIVATDANGKIVIFNRGAADLLGYSPEEVIGRMTYEGILPVHAVHSIREAFDSHVHGPRGKIINMEVGLLNKAKDPVPARVSGTLLFEAHKEMGTVLFIEDLREIHRLEKEKEQAQRMAAIGRTVAGLAHYIKNILTGLKGGAYVMNSAMDKSDLELVRKGWQMVEANIDQIGMIVSDMLIYSSQRTPKMELVEPNELVTEILELMDGKAKTAGVQLNRDFQPDLEKVPMDRTAIHRCLLNLVSNAIDACTLEGIVGGRGIVTVKTEARVNGGVRFHVTDNGTGMDEATQKKLFTDFFTTKGYKGTGLGLPVTRKIAEEHGGKLSFQTRLGEGTKFTLALPGVNH
jgi:PAS domain S-box-containing protein